MMGRITILIVIAGGAFVVLGFQEYRVSSGCSDQPEQASLADIERGNRPDNNHLRLGPHFAVLAGAVYECRLDDGRETPVSSSKVTHTYYGIYSIDSPVGQQIQALNAKYGSYSAWPEERPEAEWIDPRGLAMVVKTTRFKTVGGIPDDLRRSESVQGLVVNDIHSMDDEEKKLLLASFGGMLENIDDLLILQEGRTPTKLTTALAAMGGGLALIVAPIAFVIRRSRRRLVPIADAAPRRARTAPVTVAPAGPPHDDPLTDLTHVGPEANQSDNPYSRTD